MNESPAAAAVLTILFTGLGPFYNHQFVKGLMLLAPEVVSRVPSFYGDPGRLWGALLVVTQVGIFSYAVADAYLVARRHEREWMSAFPSWKEEAEPYR